MRATLGLLAALALAGCGTGTDDAAAPQPATVTVTETQTEAETPTPQPEVKCSTAGLRTTLAEQDLPDAVAEVREAVYGAALACDYDELERLALERGEGFTFSYSGGTSAAAYWRELEEGGTGEPMRALVTILSLPYTRNESGSYAWPTAYQESPTAADWQALVDAGLQTQEEVDPCGSRGSPSPAPSYGDHRRRRLAVLRRGRLRLEVRLRPGVSGQAQNR